MIVSRTHKYVYIGIPRTASKSMNRWLMDHFDGEWYGDHHQWLVPEEFREYLIFTIVRNPYERAISGWFFEPAHKDGTEPPRPATFAEGMKRLLPLRHGPGTEMNQKAYVDRAGISLVLYFEHLTDALQELPFVQKRIPFPHNNKGGFRPPTGNFFDHFSMTDETLVWEYASEDFTAFGYRRFDCGGPSVAHKWIKA